MAVKSKHYHKQQEDEQSMKGTLLSVSFVAGVIIIMWVAVFWIYMIRV